MKPMMLSEVKQPKPVIVRLWLFLRAEALRGLLWGVVWWWLLTR